MSATENSRAGGRPEAKRGKERPRLWPAVRAVLRTRIVAGLAMVIPLWVIWVVARFVFDTMRSATEPIVLHIVRALVKSDAPITTEEALAQAPPYVQWIIPVVAVLLTLFALYVLGLLTANVFGRRIVLLVERLFENLPLVKTIYGSVKRIVLTLGAGEAMQFQKVVLVEFPRPGMKCIGFLTSVLEDVDTGRKMATVFISTTPNPTTGYMQIVPLDEVSETGWTVEEAVKLLMSGGILSPAKVPFDNIHTVKWNQVQAPVEGAATRGQSLSKKTD